MDDEFKVSYENMTEFTPQELQLIQKNARIFNHPDAPLCPLCEREKSPMVDYKNGPCLYCIEESFKKRQAVIVKHLPERWPADAALIHLAHEVIKKHGLVASRASIAYLMKAKHGDKAGKIVLGSCAKQSPKVKMLHGWDFIIEIAWDMWAFFTDHQREALLMHELCHIAQDDGLWKIEGHSVEEHTPVIEAYGLWKPDLRLFAEAVKLAEESDGQEKLFNDTALGAAQSFIETINDGDSIEYSGPGIDKRRLVKKNGKMVKE